MLSMKTLRVAIVTMGSALLLGSGLAVAQDNINLNGDAAGMDAPSPLLFAQETLPAPVMGARALEFDEVVNIGVEPRRAIGASEEVFLRIDLDGAMFGDNPTAASGPADFSLGTTDHALNSGGAGEAFAVFAVGTVPVGGVLAVSIPDNTAGGDLMVTAATGNITATITAYTDPDDALDQIGARSTFSGSGAIVRLVSGLTVTISPAMPAPTASVAHGFLWFLNAAGTGPTGQVRLGWLGIEENLTPAGTAGAVRNAATGVEPLVAGNILQNDGTDPDGTISFNIMGNLDVGAFTVKDETFLDANNDNVPDLDDDGNRTPTGTCDGVAEGGVDRGTLIDAASMPLIGEDGERPSGVTMASTPSLSPGVKLVCLNVDVMGPETNMYPIPEGDYMATAHFKTGANALEASQMAGMEGSLASIGRNGASVDIPYLTTSEKHNQRVIVVNRGTAPVAISAITFTSEDGTEVELTDTVQAAMDAGLLVVPGQSSWVGRMDETIMISGNSRRTAATIAFDATPGAISVATTQVNVSDGSTDTVVYMVD